jgi:hypothetical protein
MLSSFRYSPWLWAGQPNILAIAREYQGVYLIVLAVERNSNSQRALSAPTVNANLRVPGIASLLKVQARLQGSVYIFRNDTGTPTLYVRLFRLCAMCKNRASHPIHLDTLSNVSLFLIPSISIR